MQEPDVLSLSLGQWVTKRRAWDRVHGDNKPNAPSDDEFDRAVEAVRTVY